MKKLIIYLIANWLYTGSKRRHIDVCRSGQCSKLGQRKLWCSTLLPWWWCGSQLGSLGGGVAATSAPMVVV